MIIRANISSKIDKSLWKIVNKININLMFLKYRFKKFSNTIINRQELITFYLILIDVNKILKCTSSKIIISGITRELLYLIDFYIYVHFPFLHFLGSFFLYEKLLIKKCSLCKKTKRVINNYNIYKLYSY